MGWQCRGFCLLSGHAFMICTQSSKIIDVVVSAKECEKCKAAKKENMLAKKHKCPRNYNGSSKAMETDAAFVLTQRLYGEKNVLVQKIVADDDSSMKAILRYSCQQNGQKKKDAGQLPLLIPEPQWLADPMHRTKVVANKFFEIMNK
eukprot:15351015-Ditylum_brightwellii.AAC.1